MALPPERIWPLKGQRISYYRNNDSIQSGPSPRTKGPTCLDLPVLEWMGPRTAGDLPVVDYRSRHWPSNPRGWSCRPSSVESVAVGLLGISASSTLDSVVYVGFISVVRSWGRLAISRHEIIQQSWLVYRQQFPGLICSSPTPAISSSSPSCAHLATPLFPIFNTAANVHKSALASNSTVT